MDYKSTFKSTVYTLENKVADMKVMSIGRVHYPLVESVVIVV